MSEHDVHTLTGAYATHALPEDERREFAEHLAQCPACRQEVAELSATAARLGAAAAAPAPDTLRDRVLAEVARTRQVSPLVTDLADRRRQVPWYRQPFGVAASFLMVLALGLGAFAVTESRRADRAEQTAAQITAVATDPGRAETTRPISSGGASMLIAAGDRAIFRADGVRVLPSNRVYQLWVMDDKGGARSVGLLGRGSSRHLQQFIEGVKPTDQVGLTVEPEGGSPGPTTQPLVALPVKA